MTSPAFSTIRRNGLCRFTFVRLKRVITAADATHLQIRNNICTLHVDNAVGNRRYFGARQYRFSTVRINNWSPEMAGVAMTTSPILLLATFFERTSFFNHCDFTPFTDEINMPAGRDGGG